MIISASKNPTSFELPDAEYCNDILQVPENMLHYFPVFPPGIVVETA